MKEGNKKQTGAEEDDEWRKRGKKPPLARRLERRLDRFLFLFVRPAN